MPAVCIRASVAAPPAFLVPEDELTEREYRRSYHFEAHYFTRLDPFTGRPSSQCSDCGTLHPRPMWWGRCSACVGDNGGLE